MIKKIAIPVVICVLLVFCLIAPATGKEEVSYRVETFTSGDGWGYQIRKKETVIIHQPSMPCVSGNKPFPDEESARGTGELVVSKIKNSETPLITRDELDSILN